MTTVERESVREALLSVGFLRKSKDLPSRYDNRRKDGSFIGNYTEDFYHKDGTHIILKWGPKTKPSREKCMADYETLSRAEQLLVLSRANASLKKLSFTPEELEDKIVEVMTERAMNPALFRLFTATADVARRKNEARTAH